MGIETAVWRALAVFRALGLAYAVVVYARRVRRVPAPGLAAGPSSARMTVWTVVVAGLYSRPAGRRWPVLALDLLIAMVAVDLPRLLDDPDRIVAGAQTLPVVWAAAPVLAFAIKGGWPAGLGAAAAVSAADLLHRGALTVPTANNIVLLVLAGVVVGYTVDLARRGETALTEALAVEAATRERERLSRGIHDGVLQVLALVGPARAGGRRRGGRDRPAGRRAGAGAAGAGRLVSARWLPGRSTCGRCCRRTPRRR